MLFLVIVIVSLGCVLAAQESLSYFASLSEGLEAPVNQVYFLLVIFALITYLTPIISYIYRVFLTKIVKEVRAKAKELQQKIRYAYVYMMVRQASRFSILFLQTVNPFSNFPL